MTDPAATDNSRRQWWALAAIVAVLAFAASFNGLWNDFTYDDRFIVWSNPVVHDLRRAWTLFVLPYWPIAFGGDGYRPLTLLAFGIQWALAPDSPFFFHVVTIGLYITTCVAVFGLASLLVRLPWAWLTAALFAVHPVHVEAVANVVGQAEVWVALLVVTATGVYLRARRAGSFSVRSKCAIALMYFAACLFKEHAVVLPALLLASDLLLIVDDRRQRIASLRPFYLSLSLLACVYLAFRYLVVGKGATGFTPFVPFVSMHVDYVHRVLTMLGVAPHWVRLLLWPAKLSSEYGPPAYPIATGVAVWQLPGLLIIATVLAAAAYAARRAPVVAFGLLWTIVTLLPSSNFILPSGILLAERTLFLPSVGALVAVVAALSMVSERVPSSRLARLVTIVTVESLLVAGMAASIVHTAVWRNNTSLFTSAVVTSPRVYRSHYMLGTWLMAKKNYALGEREYLAALRLFPNDPFVAYNLGQEYFRGGDYEDAYRMYALSMSVSPDFQDVTARMALARAAQGRYAEARILATRAIASGVGDLKTLRAILNAASLDARSRAQLAAGVARQPVSVVAR